MYRRTYLAGAVLAAGATFLAGCGAATSDTKAADTAARSVNNSAQTPASELSHAVLALGNNASVTASVRVGLSASELETIAHSTHTGLPPKAASLIAGMQVTVEQAAPSGKKIADHAPGGAASVTISDNGTNYLSLRTINKTVYIQLDLADLLKAVGAGSALAHLQAVSPLLPDFAKALVNGQWVSITPAGIKELVKLLGVSLPAAPSPEAAAQLQSALLGILTSHTRVTRVASGQVDVLVISANARAIARALLKELKIALPADAALLTHVHARTIPSRRVRVTAQVTGGTLSVLSINLGQFAGRKAPRVPLNVTFTANGAAINTPSGAVPVDVSAIAALLGSHGGLGSFLGGSSGSGISS